MACRFPSQILSWHISYTEFIPIFLIFIQNFHRIVCSSPLLGDLHKKLCFFHETWGHKKEERNSRGRGRAQDRNSYLECNLRTRSIARTDTRSSATTLWDSKTHLEGKGLSRAVHLFSKSSSYLREGLSPNNSEARGFSFYLSPNTFSSTSQARNYILIVISLFLSAHQQRIDCKTSARVRIYIYQPTLYFANIMRSVKFPPLKYHHSRPVTRDERILKEYSYLASKIQRLLEDALATWRSWNVFQAFRRLLRKSTTTLQATKKRGRFNTYFKSTLSNIFLIFILSRQPCHSVPSQFSRGWKGGTSRVLRLPRCVGTRGAFSKRD